MLLAILDKYISGAEDLDEWELIEELANQRADSLIAHALKGYGMSIDEAIELLSDRMMLDDHQQEVAGVISAAIDNMADFGAAQEYQVISAMKSMIPYDLWDIEDLDDDELAELLAEFATYNKRYAHVENLDVEYAMSMAAQWILVATNQMLMYMTMGDERVRPWHLALEGYMAPKMLFPAWMIPPIEHQCRCYLVEVGVNGSNKRLSDVKAEIVKVPVKPEGFNDVFKESVCLGGRIFSDAHSYFQVNPDDYGRLRSIADNIKKRYNVL